RERGPVGAAGEPLVAVDDVVIPLAPRGGPELGRVGAGALRLGHREAAPDLTGGQRLQPAPLVLGAAVLVEDLEVAGVGRLAAEHQVSDGRAPELLAHHSVFLVRDTATTE